MSLSIRIICSVVIAVTLVACTPFRHTKDPEPRTALVAAPGGKKVDYTYALNKTRKFTYTVSFVDPDPTSEWSPAMWFILEHKDATPAYQFTLFQDSDGSIRPEIRLLNLADKRERMSIKPDVQVAATSEILVEIEIDENRVTSSINGSVIDTTELSFPIDELRVGFSSGTFSIKGESPGAPAVGS